MFRWILFQIRFAKFSRVKENSYSWYLYDIGEWKETEGGGRRRRVCDMSESSWRWTIIVRTWVNKWVHWWVLQMDFCSWWKSVWSRTIGFEWTVKECSMKNCFEWTVKECSMKNYFEWTVEVCLYSANINNGWFCLDLHINSEFVIIRKIFFLLSSTLLLNLHSLLFSFLLPFFWIFIPCCSPFFYPSFESSFLVALTDQTDLFWIMGSL